MSALQFSLKTQLVSPYLGKQPDLLSEKTPRWHLDLDSAFLWVQNSWVALVTPVLFPSWWGYLHEVVKSHEKVELV